MNIAVRVKTGASTDLVVFDEAKQIYLVTVKARPLEGEANKAIISLLSKYLDVPKSQIVQVSGLKSKYKRFKF